LRSHFVIERSANGYSWRIELTRLKSLKNSARNANRPSPILVDFRAAKSKLSTLRGQGAIDTNLVTEFEIAGIGKASGIEPLPTLELRKRRTGESLLASRSVIGAKLATAKTLSQSVGIVFV